MCISSFFFSSRRRHTRCSRDWSSDVCSSDLVVTGLETAFASLHTELVVPGVIDLPLLVERMTAGGEPFGLALPSLTPGSPANITLLDLGAAWQVGESGYESRSANCAFGGRAMAGRVRMTIAAGAVAYRERSFAIGAVPA